MVSSLNPKLVNLIHIVLVAPLLAALALDKFPQEYKKYVLYLAILVAVYHLYKLYKSSASNNLFEGLDINGSYIHHIRMFDSSPGYEKPNLCIKQGDVVVWSNVGEIDHTVTGVNNEFNSGYMKPGDRFSVKFSEKGVFNYYCMVSRGWMIGKITVN